MFHRYISEKRTVSSDLNLSILMDSDEESECSSDFSEDEEEDTDHIDIADYSYPDDYWKLKRAIKYIPFGRPVITALTLLVASDCDFQDPIMLQFVKDNNLLETLLNFVESSKDHRLQSICLGFLTRLSQFRVIRVSICHLGGLETMVSLLQDPRVDMNREAAGVIGVASDFHESWSKVRRAGGVDLLVYMMFLPRALLFEPDDQLSNSLRAVIRAAETAAASLIVICRCRRNRIAFLSCGGLLACRDILQSPHARLCTLALQLIEKCASEKFVRVAVSKLGMLKDFGVHFFHQDSGVVRSAALAAFRCADGDESRNFFGQPGFVDRLLEILQQPSNHTDFPLMIAVSGALWKCAEASDNNMRRLQTPLLVQLLATQPKRVLENLVACLECCMKDQEMRTTIRKNNGIEAMIRLLFTIHRPLIMHLNRALALASDDPECLAIMESNGALRLIWSHLKNGDPAVVSNTAWQLARIFKNVTDSAPYVQSFMGGVQVVMKCLESKHTRVTTAACAFIVVLCKKEANIKTLTDYQVVDALTTLSDTRCSRLRYHLCLAISACCLNNPDNREEFAQRRIAYPLVAMLKSKTPEVSGAATIALEQIACLPKWCALLYNAPGVYRLLLGQLRNDNPQVQESAAEILQKMRLFALNRDGYVPPWMIKKHALIPYKDDTG